MQKKPIVFTDYPNLKFGFTTQNFIEVLPVTVESVKKLIDYAEQNGYSWIELRDPDAILKPEECNELASYAKEKKIEAGYAIQRGILDADFWDTFSRGLKNAVFFEGPRTIRCLIGGDEFGVDPEKKGWTADELERLVKTANLACEAAEENGLHLACENSYSDLRTNGDEYYGLEAFFEKVNPNVLWQFDVANFFCAPRVEISPEDAKAFFEANIERIAYIHLKTVENRRVLDFLADHPLDYDTVFSLMSKCNVPYIAIELNAIRDIDEIFKNHEKSIRYMHKKEFFKE